jgi:hypothetical protein
MLRRCRRPRLQQTPDHQQQLRHKPINLHNPPSATWENPLIMISNSTEKSRAYTGPSSASGTCLSTGTNDERTVAARGPSASLRLLHL